MLRSSAVIDKEEVGTTGHAEQPELRVADSVDVYVSDVCGHLNPPLDFASVFVVSS